MTKINFVKNLVSPGGTTVSATASGWIKGWKVSTDYRMDFQRLTAA